MAVFLRGLYSCTVESWPHSIRTAASQPLGAGSRSLGSVAAFFGGRPWTLGSPHDGSQQRPGMPYRRGMFYGPVFSLTAEWEILAPSFGLITRFGHINIRNAFSFSKYVFPFRSITLRSHQ